MAIALSLKNLTMKSSLILIFLITCLLSQAQVDEQKVNDFARNYSYQNNIPLAEVEAILSKAEFQSSIIEKMERPAEGTMTWTRYRNIFMQDDRINAGVAFWKENESILNAVSADSGIPVAIILGILGVETFFGQRKGTYQVLDALYTLAFAYPKRSKFFTSELGKFIDLSRKENLDIGEVKGSYAGAIGYCQFMPSSYIAYAKSYDEGGNVDLVNSVDDAIASVANYLKVHRWRQGEPIVAEAVKNTSDTYQKQSLKPKYKIDHYRNLGYALKNETIFNQAVSLIELEKNEGNEYWFGFNNFYVITRYNHSSLYAMAVYQLGEAIKERNTD